MNEDPEVIVQLQRSDTADCWEGRLESPPANNTAKRFRDVALQ